MSIQSRAFGHLPDGTVVDQYRLESPSGMVVSMLNVGGVITSLTIPGADGSPVEMTLGLGNMQDILTDRCFMGCLVGRYANRIARGRFQWNDEHFALSLNNGANHLHGGSGGFGTRFWLASPRESAEGPALVLRRVSPDGEEGYPGNLEVEARFTLLDSLTLRLEFEAICDAMCPVSLTQHSYFNLSGEPSTILDHELYIPASRIVAIDHDGIPTGELLPVTHTPFDFQAPAIVGGRIDHEHPQLINGHGYDHNWVLHREHHEEVSLCARLHHPRSGRTLEVLSNAPGIQFYSGNFLDGTGRDVAGRAFGYRAGCCLEPQHFPDAPNQPHFPSPWLRPGDTYRHTILYRFGA